MVRRGLGMVVALGAAMVASTVTESALAHGGAPRAINLAVEPGNPEHIIALSDVWGSFATIDGGGRWSYSCAELWGEVSVTPARRSLAVAAGGKGFLAALFAGLEQGAGDGCAWQAVSELAGEVVQDVSVTSADGRLLHALTSTGGASGVAVQVWESPDAGASWSKLGAPLPANAVGFSVRVAPSDPSRVYVSGRDISPDAGLSGAVVYISTDAGGSWQQAEVASGGESWIARLTLVSPQDPDTVLLWMDEQQRDGSQEVADSLWASADGGSSWRQVFAGAGDLPGHAVDPDGLSSIVSGPADGLWRASFASLAADSATPFARVSSVPLYGLAYAGSTLYAGGDDYAGPERFLIGKSTDGGATFSSVLSACDLALAECGGRAATAECQQAWGGTAMFVEDNVAPYCSGADAGVDGGSAGGSGSGGGAGSVDAAPGTPDGGAAGPAGTAAGGACTCRVGSRHTASSGAFTAALSWLAVALLNIRRRKS